MPNQDTGQERTEKATPRRREQAFDEGQVPRSQELSGAMVLLAGVGALALGGGRSVADALQRLVAADISWTLTGDPSPVLMGQVLRRTVLVALTGMAPVIVALLSLSLVVNLVQARGIVSLQPVAPKLSHLSPWSGIKRMIGLQAVFTLLKSVIKLAFLAFVTYLVMRSSWSDLLPLSLLEPAQIVRSVVGLSLKLGAVTGLAFLAVAVADYLFQVYQFERNIRMTHQEVSREMKDSEGDPLIKSRLRSMAQSMTRKRMMSEVPTADVVVTNPTRLAVALRYDPERAAAPMVVAMGARKLAARIRAIAREHDVPIVENKPLAQALMATAQVGQPIPAELYLAVAEVLAFVYRQQTGSGMRGVPAGVEGR